MYRALVFFLLLPQAALAADADYTLIIEDHRFQPSELAIPQGKKVRILIENHDATPEEFDSYALNREKIITAHGKATLFIGPLDAGSYPFIGEYHADTAKGLIIAK
jgi:hypothetical protein